MQLPNGEVAQAMKNGEDYKQLGFQPAGYWTRSKKKVKSRSNTQKKIKSLMKSELNAGNLVQAFNTYTTPGLTYSWNLKMEKNRARYSSEANTNKNNNHHRRSHTTLKGRRKGFN